MTSPTRIGIAVVEHAGRYLVGVRGPDGPLPGLAEFPGGKCQSGELPRVCAIRECLEETGLMVLAERLLFNGQHHYAHGDVDLHFWLCRPADATAVMDDHQGYRWVPAAELATLPFPEANAPVVAMLAGEREGE